MRFVCQSICEHPSLICLSLSKSLIDSILRVACQVASFRSGIFTLTVPRIEEEKANGTSMWHFLCQGHRNRIPHDDTHRIVRFAELPHGPRAQPHKDHSFDYEPAKVSLSVNLPLSDGVCHDGKIISLSRSRQLEERICVAFVRLALAVQMNCLVIKFFERWARNWLEIHLCSFFSIY